MQLPPRFLEAPDDFDVSRVIEEIQVLENQDPLPLLAKKRLYELYSKEARFLKPGSERYQVVTDRTDKLQPDVESLFQETEKLSLQFLSDRKPPESSLDVFETPGLKRRFQEVTRLWSKEENEAALNKLAELLDGPEPLKSTTKERIKILGLRFRIAQDSLDEVLAAKSYEELRALDDCGTETAQAGFLLSLSTFGRGEKEKAATLFANQCDLDNSLANRMRRAYWAFRFNEGDGVHSAEALASLSRLPLPGYYLFLAHALKGEALMLPEKAEETPIYVLQEFKVPSAVHEALLAAEERIQQRLFRDAGLYLARAVSVLRKNVKGNYLALLYTASLYRAAGNHLEAMKIFTDVGSADWDDADVKMVNQEFLRDFPRPFQSKVNWIGKEWNVDPDFVYSIMRQESAFNPGAVSSSDARGLMQLMPFLAKFLSKQWSYRPLVSDKFLFRAEENLKLSVFHLNQLQRKAPHVALMAASYNAGLSRTSIWWRKFGHLPLDVFVEMIPVNETRNYVKLVLRNYLYYKAMKNGGKVAPEVFSLELPPYTTSAGVS